MLVVRTNQTVIDWFGILTEVMTRVDCCVHSLKHLGDAQVEFGSILDIESLASLVAPVKRAFWAYQ